jgi:2,3-bisphosphoglycerate-independent phosphoglycerate mutase
MSAHELTDRIIEKLKGPNEYSFILVNFANADMVAHTGNIPPAVEACGVVDKCVEKLADFTLAYGGTMLITADHGNAEEMLGSQGEVDTEHSVNPVPFIALSQQFLGKPVTIQAGILADIAPTVLALLNIEIPSVMTGRNLLSEVLSTL